MPFLRRKVWEDNTPDSLNDLVTRYCLTNIDILTTRSAEGLALKKDICLPAEICENFFAVAKEIGFDFTDELISIFKPGQTKLRHISLESNTVMDEGFKTILSHGLRDIDLKNCPHFTVNSLATLNKFSSELQRLDIGPNTYLLPDYLQPQGTFSDSESEDERDGNIYERQGFIIQAPNLRSLSVKGLIVKKGESYFDLLLKPLPGLLRLDLSGTNHNLGSQSNFAWLLNCKHLLSLTLHNVKNLESSLETLCQLRLLQHLDISQFKDNRGQFKEPVLFLESLIEALPNLSSLDISGTNLPSNNVNTNSPLCDIPGLTSRVKNPLNFLGLYKTMDEASSRMHIPARTITGDSCEEQILLAGQLYLDRPTVLENVLNDLFQIFRSDTCQNLKLALEVLLRAMERHKKEKYIQISGSASLYYIVKSESIKPDLNVKVKRKILSILLDGMLTHRTDPTMMRNGCLTLCHFQMPQDVLFDYERLVKILLHIVAEHTAEENNFIQRVGIFLLNSLACQVEGEQKKLVGGLGAIEKMLFIIREKLKAGICDDVMETAWSTMWNVTDETPTNCQRFLNGDGMNLFLKCKERFPEKQDLLRNMMGLLGNVAEVPTLRSHLMTSEFVDEFSFLLDSNSDGIEVSYNAAGVLAHMASDGPAAWTIEEPKREFVLARMVRAINRWQLDSRRNINYRSFEPIIRLLPAHHTPECQLWASWAIANLTKVSPEKYCSLVIEEGGLAVLETMLNSNAEFEVRPDVRTFAEMVRFNVHSWKEHGHQRLEYDG